MTARSGQGHIRAPDNLAGGLWLIASAFCFTIATSLVKYLGTSYSAASQTFYSQLIAMLILSPYTIAHASRVLRPRRRHLLVLRSGLSTAGLILSYYAYHQLPLADANALSFTRALWVFPFAALLLGERLRPAVIAAGFAAFCGVLLIGGITGNHAQWGWGMAAGLSAAMITALIAVTVRDLSRDTDAMTLLIWASLLGIVFSAPTAMVTGWQWPRNYTDVGLLVLQAVLTLAQQACYIRGLQVGEASAIAPFDYTRVIFVVIVGVLVFHEIPPVTTIIGLLVIVGAALFVVVDLSRQRRRAVAARGSG